MTFFQNAILTLHSNETKTWKQTLVNEKACSAEQNTMHPRTARCRKTWKSKRMENWSSVESSYFYVHSRKTKERCLSQLKYTAKIQGQSNEIPILQEIRK